MNAYGGQAVYLKLRVAAQKQGIEIETAARRAAEAGTITPRGLRDGPAGAAGRRRRAGRLTARQVGQKSTVEKWPAPRLRRNGRLPFLRGVPKAKPALTEHPEAACCKTAECRSAPPRSVPKRQTADMTHPEAAEKTRLRSLRGWTIRHPFCPPSAASRDDTLSKMDSGEAVPNLNTGEAGQADPIREQSLANFAR
jgi:hypothetical protein